MKKFYQSSVQEVFDSVKSNEDGLTSAEAKKRLEQYGDNVLKQKRKRANSQSFLVSLTT